MLVGYIKGHQNYVRQTVSIVGLSADQIKALRADLADYFGWERITQK
jgi:hypothetical protein